jgi:outer membrane protein OmpA-like peptidoglycan-associated protein
VPSSTAGQITSLLVVVAFVTAVGELVLFVLFNRFMYRNPRGTGGYPRPYRRGLSWVLTFFEFLGTARRAGKVWFAEKDHWVVAAVGSAIGLWEFWEALANADPQIFSRAGALIVLLGFASIFVGSIHATGLFDARAAIDANLARLERAELSERAQARSTRWTFVITAAGTLIWAYGDVLVSVPPPSLAFGSLPGIAEPSPTSMNTVDLRLPLPPVRRPFLVLFDWGSASLRPDAEQIIAAAARTAAAYPRRTIRLIGHADDSGSPEYNFNLSRRRAELVKSVLIKFKISDTEIIVFFKGAASPLVSTGKNEREIFNRGVEILVQADPITQDR